MMHVRMTDERLQGHWTRCTKRTVKIINHTPRVIIVQIEVLRELLMWTWLVFLWITWERTLALPGTAPLWKNENEDHWSEPIDGASKLVTGTVLSEASGHCVFLQVAASISPAINLSRQQRHWEPPPCHENMRRGKSSCLHGCWHLAMRTWYGMLVSPAYRLVWMTSKPFIPYVLLAEYLWVATKFRKTKDIRVLFFWCLMYSTYYVIDTF
jgi:hypothetical protein